jgi:hypothetical protein
MKGIDSDLLRKYIMEWENYYSQPTTHDLIEGINRSFTDITLSQLQFERYLRSRRSTDLDGKATSKTVDAGMRLLGRLSAIMAVAPDPWTPPLAMCGLLAFQGHITRRYFSAQVDSIDPNNLIRHGSSTGSVAFKARVPLIRPIIVDIGCSGYVVIDHKMMEKEHNNVLFYVTIPKFGPTNPIYRETKRDVEWLVEQHGWVYRPTPTRQANVMFPNMAGFEEHHQSALAETHSQECVVQRVKILRPEQGVLTYGRYVERLRDPDWLRAFLMDVEDKRVEKDEDDA